uniref:Small ribosomal subunit protein uS5c n=1 Tax=Pyropia perforata TaxID=182771 RepID=A0A023HRD6_PYRPE|nr:30S ribosomal protein S5 [Neoporphyra perforata]AGQ17115.1 30S ribosomal protein S5 [Neoporphyra perforata]AHB35074.1 30S ribosomal protein S5 [Neoporphyra perforata]AHB35283.1 30S ribosomal protein S5 [Neoporphyra perforata]AIA19445.1 30S ribosomal protein S5 [Neoporphyra perforata]AIA19654.1 30S ribosomal protein S5 [Neoporphyra perforata]
MVNRKKQSKGKDKDSGWEERVVQVKRVTKVVKGGKKLSFRVILIVGNEQGQVGVGVGKASDVIGAVKKGVTDAKKHLVTVPITKSNSIPHPINGISGAAKVILRPSAPGSGVIAGGSVRTVLELSGVQNILAKQLGSNNTLNNARAVLNGLTQLRTFSEAAKERGVPIENFYSV